MDQAAVQAAIARLEAAGKVASLSAIRRELGGGSWCDITKWRRAIMGNGDRPSNNIAVIECQISPTRSERRTHRELRSATALRIESQRHAYSAPCVSDHDVQDSPGSVSGHILD